MKRFFPALTALLLAVLPLSAQEGDSLSVVRAAEAANRAALTASAAKVTVVATRRVPRRDFHLWYGHLTDGSWGTDGNWYPAETSSLFLSLPGADGSADIQWTWPLDTVWHNPEPVCADAVSPGNEIFPMRSPDGRRLYFSSNGLFGMGGYDLYVATWDPQSRRWGNVQNMGFPYSSQADDLFFCDTPDGRYSVFASNRDCGADSVVIYVLRQETPVCMPVEPAQAAQVARLAVTAPDDGYPFVRQSPGRTPQIRFERQKDEIDDSFKVGDTGAFAVNDRIPSGIVYQVQLFVLASKPSIRQLKGVRPVYSHPQRSGKTLYAAGVFSTFADAEAALAAVRKAGHKSAIVIAFEDGKPLAVSKARKKESSVKVITEEVRIVK